MLNQQNADKHGKKDISDLQHFNNRINTLTQPLTQPNIPEIIEKKHQMPKHNCLIKHSNKKQIGD
ncbi:hypothetical protein [Methylomonas sp. AM2-LC]|uniref:hypothetical protein n=1 Tax=Methylomonas sp. AM2-LC TaxID=3153301 RepID=UPI0032642296